MVNELNAHELCIKEDDGRCLVTTLFILESPFDTELLNDCACVGSTGMNMTKILGLDSSEPLGMLLKDKDTVTKEYAVFNTFKFPLDIAIAIKMMEHHESFDLWSYEKIPWCCLKREEGEITTRLKKMIQTIKTKDLCKNYYDDYERSLNEFLKICPNLNKIVVCGKIAQAMFESKINRSEVAEDLESFSTNINGREYRVLYTIHPALWFSSDKGNGKKVKDALNRFIESER